MELLISREALRALPRSEYVSRLLTRSSEKVRVNLSELGLVDLQVLSKSASVAGKAKAEIRRAFTIRKEHANDDKPVSLQELRTCIDSIASKAYKKWFFHEGIRGELTPFEYDGVTYEPRMKNREPYVYMKCLTHSNGNVHSRRFSFYSVDGKRSVVEMLSDHDIMPASKEMFDEYVKQLARFKAYFDSYGQQFVCRAFAGSSRYWYDDDEDLYRARLGRKRQKITVSEVRARVIVTSFESFLRRAQSSEDFDLSANSIFPFDEKEPTPYSLTLPVVDLETGASSESHAINLRKYKYKEGLDKKLILPKEVKDMVMLLTSQEEELDQTDVVENKGKATIIIAKGEPGTGKTLMAEVVAESVKKPLYRIHASQLGTNVETLERNLQAVLTQTENWGAVLLIDEADVFIQRRGTDLNKNAIVGVFLRTLEYCNCHVFMNTNRASDIDDAIVNRADAVIQFKMPEEEARKEIWRIHNDIVDGGLSEQQIAVLAAEHEFTGRTIKKSLALAKKVAIGINDGKVTPAILKRVMRFVPGGPIERPTVTRQKDD